MQTTAEIPTTPVPKASPIHLKRILVPVDFSDPSAQAFTYALRFAEEFGSEITLLRILDKSSLPSDVSELPAQLEYSKRQLFRTQNQLRALIDAKNTPGYPVIRSVVRKGIPPQEI